jgi:hypothetical protein
VINLTSRDPARLLQLRHVWDLPQLGCAFFDNGNNFVSGHG